MCNTMAFAYGVLTPHRTNLIVGVSIVIGAIGGVYLLQRGARYFCQLTEKKPRKKPDDICNVCFTKLDVEDFKSCVTCCNCQKFVCRGRQCTIWIPSQAGWECQLCSLSSESRSRASEWLHQQINEKYLRPMSSRSNPSIPTKDYCNDFDTNSEAPSSYCSEQREKVRGYVEEALAQILGGSLDNVSVGQMFKSQEYLPLWESEECPGVSHVKLKRLIEKIIQETLRLPALFDYSGIPGRTEESLPFFDPKKYQELLATAVLNKIVDSYNYEKKFELENNNEDLDKNHNPIITAKNKVVSQSSSSIEPGSDSSITDTAVNIGRDDDAYPSDTDSNLHSDLVTGSVHTGNESVLSDYVARHQVPLPELTLDSESPDDDIMSVVTTKSTEGNWEDNWLFKKKKRGNEATATVGMLVPSPREDIRTLIGDKTADEVSDLSEGSDFEDNECNDMKTQNDTDLPNVLIQNKNVIGGKSTVGLFDELLEQTSMISTTSIQDGEAAFTECKNEHVLNDEGLNDVAAPPKLDLSNNNAQIVVESEAINSHVNSEIFTNGAASQKELLVLSPPEHFEDSTETKVTECNSQQNNETETNLDSLEQAQINEKIEEEINTNQNTNTNTNITSENETEASPGVEKGRKRSLDISAKIVTDVIENASSVKLLAALALTPLIAPITSDDCMESHIPEIPCHHEIQSRDALEEEDPSVEIVLISVNKKDDESRVKSPDTKKVTFAECTSGEERSPEMDPAERKELLAKMDRYSETDDWQDAVDAPEHLFESEPSEDKDVILQLLLQAPPGFEDATSQIHINDPEEIVESGPIDTSVLPPIIPNKSEQHAEDELSTDSVQESLVDGFSEDASKLEETSKPDLSNMSDNATDLCPHTQKTELAQGENLEKLHSIVPVDNQNEESLCVDKERDDKERDDKEQTFNISTNSSSLQGEGENSVNNSANPSQEEGNSTEKRNPCDSEVLITETPEALPEQKTNFVKPDLDNEREESQCSHNDKEKYPASQEKVETSVNENFTNIQNVMEIKEASNPNQEKELIPSDPIVSATEETEVAEGQAFEKTDIIEPVPNQQSEETTFPEDDKEKYSDQQVSDAPTTLHGAAENSNNKSHTEIQKVTEKEESLSHDDNEQFSEERKLDKSCNVSEGTTIIEEVENSVVETSGNIQNVTENEEAKKTSQEKGSSSEELIARDTLTPAESSLPIDKTIEVANTQSHEEVESPDPSKEEGPVLSPSEESMIRAPEESKIEEINDAVKESDVSHESVLEHEINDALECIILTSPPGFGDEPNLSYEVGSMLPIIEEEGIEGMENEATDQDAKVSEEDVTVEELSVPENKINKFDESIPTGSSPGPASEMSPQGIESIEKSDPIDANSQPAQLSHCEESVGFPQRQGPNSLIQKDTIESKSNERDGGDDNLANEDVLDTEKLQAEALETTTVESLQIYRKVRQTGTEELVTNDTGVQHSVPSSEAKETDCVISSCGDELILPPMEFEDVTIEDTKPNNSIPAEALLQTTEPSLVAYEEVTKPNENSTEVEAPSAQSDSQDVLKDDPVSTQNMVVEEEVLENFHDKGNTSEMTEESVIQTTHGDAPDYPTEVEDSPILDDETNKKSVKTVQETSGSLADIPVEMEKEGKPENEAQPMSTDIPKVSSKELNCSLYNEHPVEASSASDQEECRANTTEEPIEAIEPSVSQDFEKNKILETADVLPESIDPSSVDSPSEVGENISYVELLGIVDVKPPSEFQNELLAAPVDFLPCSDSVENINETSNDLQVKDSESEFPSEPAETFGKIQAFVEPPQHQKIEMGSGDGHESANRQEDSLHTKDTQHERRPSMTQSSEIVGSAKKGSRRASLKRDSAIERELEETLRDFDKTISSLEEENQFLSIGSEEEEAIDVTEKIEGMNDLSQCREVDKIADFVTDGNPLNDAESDKSQHQPAVFEEINQSKDASSSSLAEDTLNQEPEALGEIMSAAIDAGNVEQEVKENIEQIQENIDPPNDNGASETDSSASKGIFQPVEAPEIKDEKQNTSNPEIDLEGEKPGPPTAGIHDDKKESEKNEVELDVELHPTKAEISGAEAITEETIVTPSQENHLPSESVNENETEYTKLKCSTEKVLEAQNDDPSDIFRTVSPATFIKENMNASNLNIECSSPLDSLILEPPPENLCSSPLHTFIPVPAPPDISEESETELGGNEAKMESVEDLPGAVDISQDNSSEEIVAEASPNKTLLDSDTIETEKSMNSLCLPDDLKVQGLSQDNICASNPGQTHKENDEEVEKIEEGDEDEKISTTEAKQPTEAELQETNIQESPAPKEISINLEASVDSEQCKQNPVQEQIQESTDQDIQPQICSKSQKVIERDIQENTFQEIQSEISELSQESEKEGILTETSNDLQPITLSESHKEEPAEGSSDQLVQAEISEPPPKIKEEHIPKETASDSIQNHFHESSVSEAEAEVHECPNEVKEEDTSEQIVGDHQTAIESEQCKEESISDKVQENSDIEAKAATSESLQEVKAKDSAPKILKKVVESEHVQKQFGDGNHNEAVAGISDEIPSETITPNVPPVTTGVDPAVKETIKGQQDSHQQTEADQVDVAPTIPGVTAESVLENENESQETCEATKNTSGVKDSEGIESLTFVTDSQRAISPLTLMRQISMEVTLNLESCFSELDSLVLSPPPRELCSSPLESLIVVPPPPDMESLDAHPQESDPGQDGSSDGKVDKSPNKLETSDAKSLQPLGDNLKPITNIDMTETPNPSNDNDEPTKSDTFEPTSLDENKNTNTSTQEIVQTEIKSQSSERNDPNETTCNKILETEMSGSPCADSLNHKPEDPDLTHHHDLMKENETNDFPHNPSISPEAKERIIISDHSSEDCGVAGSESSEEPTDGGEQSKSTKSSEGADTSNTSGSGDPPNNQTPSDPGTPTGSEGNGSGGNEDEDSKKGKKVCDNEQPEQKEDDSHENENTNTLLQVKESEAMEERRFSYSTIGQLDVEFGKELRETPTPKRSIERNAEIIANNLRDELLNSEQENMRIIVTRERADLDPESISVEFFQPESENQKVEELSHIKPVKCDGEDNTSNELGMCTDSTPESSVNEPPDNENRKLEGLSQVELPKRDGKEIDSIELEKCTNSVPGSINTNHAESESSANESLNSKSQKIICSNTEITLNDPLLGDTKDMARISAIVENSSKEDTKNIVPQTYSDTTGHEDHKTTSETLSTESAPIIPDSLLKEEIINDESSENSIATPLDEKVESPTRTVSNQIVITETIIEANEVMNVQTVLCPKLSSESKAQDERTQDGAIIIVREETGNIPQKISDAVQRIPSTLESMEYTSFADDGKTTLTEFINETLKETERQNANKSEPMLVPDCDKSTNQVPLLLESVENDRANGEHESSSDTHIEEPEANEINEVVRSDHAKHPQEAEKVQGDLQDAAKEAAAAIEAVEQTVNKESVEIASTAEQCTSIGETSLAQGPKSSEEYDKIKSDSMISSEDNENVLQELEVTFTETSVIPESRSDTKITDGGVAKENLEVKFENACEELSNPEHVEDTKCENLGITESRTELNKTETSVELESSENTAKHDESQIEQFSENVVQDNHQETESSTVGKHETPDTKDSTSSLCKIFVQSPSEEDGAGTITEIESNATKSENQPSTIPVPEEETTSVEVYASVLGPNQEQTDSTCEDTENSEENAEHIRSVSDENLTENSDEDQQLKSLEEKILEEIDETPKSECAIVEPVLERENADENNITCTAELDEDTSHSKSHTLATEVTRNEQSAVQFNDIEKGKLITESQKEDEDLEKGQEKPIVEEEALEKALTNTMESKTDNNKDDDSHQLQINATTTFVEVEHSDAVEHKVLGNSEGEGTKSEEPNVERYELQTNSITNIVKESEHKVLGIHTNEDTESENPKAEIPLDKECYEVQNNAVKDDRQSGEPQVEDGVLEKPCEKDSEEPEVESHEEQANTTTNIMEEVHKDSEKSKVEDLTKGKCDEDQTSSIEPHVEIKETSPSDISQVNEIEQSSPNDASTESETEIETRGLATDTTRHLPPSEAENETTKEKRLRQLKIKSPSMIIAREESKTGSSLGISHQHTVDLPVIIPKIENMAKAAMNSSSETSEVTPNITTEIERHKELPTNLETVESTQDTSIPTNKTTNSSDSDSINSQKHQKLETLKNTTFSKHLGQEENALETLGQLLPGSIAERERLKWYSAVEMPNNPYSPEALKQRLSIGSEKPIDIPNISTSIDLTSSQDMPNQIDETAEGASKLQIVIGAHKPDQRRYGRDYYINEAKYANIIASGGSESVKETEKLSSTLSLNNEDQHMENKVKQYSTESTTNSSNSSVRRSSSGSEKPSLENCDLFTARPVRVEESDPILNKAIKLEYLSTPERDFYLLPSEEVENLKTPNQSDTSSQLSQNLDSLTASEDSDTIRVYDLNNQETRIIKDEKLKENLEPDITKQRPNILSLTPKVGQQTQQQQAQKKIITPTSLKFLQPKRKLFDPRRIMSVDSGLKSPIFENNPMMTSTSSLDSPDKIVIEEELISALPSVKALAKAFSNNTDSTPVTPVYKSKATTLNSVEVKSPVIHEEIHEEVIEGNGPSSDSYSPPYNRTYYPVETSQPTEVVESVVSVTQEEPVEQLNEVTEANEIVQEFETLVEAEENHVEEHHPEIEIIVNVQKHDSLFESSNERSSLERPISPVLVPGLLKNNIAFFENLKNK